MAVEDVVREFFDKIKRWTSARTLGIVACCALMCANLTACNQVTATTVAQDIVNMTPALTSAIQTIGSTVALLDPAAAPIVTVATAGFNAAATLVVANAKAYLANPSASVLVNLQTAVMTLQQNASAALLQASGIKDANSQKLALAAINGLATVVTTILGLVQSVSSKAELRQMRALVRVQLARVRPLMDEQKMQEVAAQYDGVSVDSFFAYEAAAGF